MFSSPPSRYSEASLIKKLEAEGIGRPSTYASIIDVIQFRKYVEKINGSFHPTDLGEVVTEKLIEGFPILMGVDYTRSLEERLDNVASGDVEWIEMLHDFYGRFSKRLETAYEEMSHAKAETSPAPYKCPECGSTISIDENSYSNIVKHVRDQEFEDEITKRLELHERDKQKSVDLAIQKIRFKMQETEFSNEKKIKIGLLVPMTGEDKYLGQLIMML